MFFNFSRRKLALLSIDFAVLLILYTVSCAIGCFTLGVKIDFLVYILYFLISAVMIFSLRSAFRVYSHVLRYANSTVYISMVIADGFCAIILLAIGLIPSLATPPAIVTVAYMALSNVATLSSRFLYRIIYKRSHRDSRPEHKGRIGVAIVGAGQVGTLLCEELLYNEKSPYYPVCFVDKDANKIGSKVLGLPVYREDEKIVDTLSRLPIGEVFIALTKISAEQTKALHELYASTGCKVKLYDVPIKEASSQNQKRVIRDINIEDLLFRDSLVVSGSLSKEYYKDKCVLVTGGGGSIGSELCRQIAACAPKRLVILDIYENNAYDIQQELLRKYGDSLPISVEIGSVRERARLEAVFRAYRPQIVIHAAAHKHVPLMEHSNAEAVKNNVFGTYNTADMAEKYGAEKFILISTDKAVNPTNVMGATKRLCEMVVQCRTDSKTSFVAVRFGNVLGSNGSVIPLFKRQIEAGGPVTITDKRIIRYFMTIPEATGLVIQAGAMAGGGDLFVLDMGKPVRILDLAENMIKLSGFTPYKDIDIKEIGLRPGEKLYEELLIKTESLKKTESDMIFIEHDTPFTREEVEDKLALLREAIKAAELNVADESVKAAIKSVVPTYREPSEINSESENAAEMKIAMV
ncbi:MAG: polysaccharide biosynthesis protein [Ruminococcaceae bacterium]|nr:polysaccharide biosynthesis protein [Oscillospiraceae bacterium]